MLSAARLTNASSFSSQASGSEGPALRWKVHCHRITLDEGLKSAHSLRLSWCLGH